METTQPTIWNPLLSDPIGRRGDKPRSAGQTMIMDKGLGLHAFEDLLQTSASYIDLIKIGFGTSPLYPRELLQRKIELAKANQIGIYPGGTFLEIALAQDVIPSYFEMVDDLGFTGIEVSDGTLEIDRYLRSHLIAMGVDRGLTVITEYGKKRFGTSIELDKLLETVHADLCCGASMVIVEGRESGNGVGIYDHKGDCKEEDIKQIIDNIPDQNTLMWEAPHKSQQIYLIKALGTNINLGNIAVSDIMSVESLRRGLRSDTLDLINAPPPTFRT